MRALVIKSKESGQLFSLQAFTNYMEKSLRFEISLQSNWPKLHWGEFQFMWTLIMKLLYTEMKFYPEVKSETSLSSLRVSCKCALLLSNCWHNILKLCKILVNFDSPEVRWCLISIIKNIEHESPTELPNGSRLKM